MSNLISILNQPSAQSAVALDDTPVPVVLKEQEGEALVESQTIKPDAIYVQACTPVADPKHNPFSNKVQLIHADLYYPGAFRVGYQALDFKNPFQYNEEVADNFRYAAQKYWYGSGPTINFTKIDLLPNHEVPFEIRVSHPTVNEDGVLPSIVQNIHLLPNKDLFLNKSGNFDRSMWYVYVNGGAVGNQTFQPLVELDKNFQDHTFEHRLPIEDEISVLAKKASISINYNFHIREFEAVSSSRKLPETIIPNVYAMIAHIENLAGNPHVESLNKLDGMLENILIAQSNGESLTFRDNAQYFDEWAKNAQNVSESWKAEMARRFGDIMFSGEELDSGLLDLAKEREKTYPFSIQVDFTTDSTTEFTQILRDSLLSKNFSATLVRDLISHQENFNNSIKEQDYALCRKFNSVNPLIDSISLRTWDVTEWWMKLEQQLQNNTLTFGNGTSIQDPTKNINTDLGSALAQQVQQVQTEAGQLASDNQAQPFSVLQGLQPADFGTFLDAYPDLKESEEHDPFYVQLLRVIFAGKMRKFVKKHLRDYCAILSGEQSYSEPVMYRISKHAALPSGQVLSAPTQNFYFPNSNDIDVISFVDTQIKYNRSYVYKIWSYYVIVGNEYRYLGIPPIPLSPNRIVPIDNNEVASFKVKTIPKLTMVEIEQQTFDAVRLMDDPPLPPMVDFIPYIGNDRKLGISLCNSLGEIRMDPVAIEPTDSKEIDMILRKQQSQDGRIRYAGDDSIDQFEIFRTRTHPSSYEDYEDNKLAIISTMVASNNIQRTSEVTFVDNLVPNVKYYYVFRAKDVHGHKSNPTEIYEVELVNNSGATYPMIRTVDFLRKEEKIPTKEFKKYLRINVAAPQKTINLEKSKLSQNNESITTAPNYIALGSRDESVFGRRFKIRITSKTSGKKIDVNFTFDNEIKEFHASDVSLNNVSVNNPGSIAAIIDAMANKK